MSTRICDAKNTLLPRVVEAYLNNPDVILGPSFNLVHCDEVSFIQSDKEL